MSQKELKAKRTKLIWYKYATRWEEFPLVILSEALRKQPWFKGKICLGNSDLRSLSNNEAKKAYKADEDDKPLCLQITQQYKTVKIIIIVEWTFQETRCGIYLKKPTTDKYYPTGYPPKQTKSRYVEGALERIKEAFREAIPAADKEIAENIEEEREEQEAIAYRKNLSETLGIPLTIPSYSSNRNHSYCYGLNRAFRMSFTKVGKDVFQIESIAGNFGIEEIKQFIKLVGGNPRAVASRLAGKK